MKLKTVARLSFIIFLKFISACSKGYSTNHVLLRLIDQRKSALDNKNFVGAVLMDLFLTASLMIYLLQNYMLMALAKTALRFSIPV